MILLDSDVLLIDLRYANDRRSILNRQALKRMQRDGQVIRITTQVMLEVVGVMSFQTTPTDVPLWPDRIKTQYGLEVIPDLHAHPVYA